MKEENYKIVYSEAYLQANINEKPVEMNGYLKVQVPHKNYKWSWMCLFKSELDNFPDDLNLEKPEKKIIKSGGGTMGDLAKLGLSGVEYQVLLCLLDCCLPGNLVTITQTDIAKHLGITRMSVFRAIKALIKMNILAKAKLKKGYQINPRIGWYGSPHQGIREAEKAPGIKPITRPKLTLIRS